VNSFRDFAQGLAASGGPAVPRIIGAPRGRPPALRRLISLEAADTMAKFLGNGEPNA